MTSVLTIANEFLNIAQRADKQLTPLQLMKLTYIANGWMLAFKDKPLFDDKIEAWKYGPVIPELYHATKEFGSKPIAWQLAAPIQDEPEPFARQLLESVWKKYGHLSGTALSNLTHRSGSPWSQYYKENQSHIEIPQAAIKAHYDEIRQSKKITSA
jgi:uncharacterized phage-associated protein